MRRVSNGAGRPRRVALRQRRSRQAAVGRTTPACPSCLTLPTLSSSSSSSACRSSTRSALSFHRINMLTKRWVFVGLQNYHRDPAQPGLHRRLRAHRLLRRRSRFSAASSSAWRMALVLNMRFPGRDSLRSVVLDPVGHVAGRRRHPLGLDAQRRLRHPQRHPLRPRASIDKPIRWLANGIGRLQSRGPGACLEPGAADLAADPGGPAVDARRTCTAPRASTAPGPLQRFFKITLPWLRPMLLLVHDPRPRSTRSWPSTSFWVMTKGGPGSATTVFSWMGYAYAFQFFKFGQGAAILYVLTIVCLLLAWLYLKLFVPAARRVPAAGRGGRGTLAATPVGADAGGRRAQRWRCRACRCRDPRVAQFRGRRGARSAGIGLAVAAILIFLWSFAPFLVARPHEPVALGRSRPHARRALIPRALTLDNYRFALVSRSVPTRQRACRRRGCRSRSATASVVAVVRHRHQRRARLARRLRLRPLRPQPASSTARSGR